MRKKLIKLIISFLIIFYFLSFVVTYIIIPFKMGSVVKKHKEVCINISVDKIIDEKFNKTMINITKKVNGKGVINLTVRNYLNYKRVTGNIKFNIFKKIYHWRSGC